MCERAQKLFGCWGHENPLAINSCSRDAPCPLEARFSSCIWKNWTFLGIST
jgi:hypothetical protein